MSTQRPDWPPPPPGSDADLRLRGEIAYAPVAPGEDPPIIVRLYRASSEGRAASQMVQEAEVFVQHGYTASSQSWSAERNHRGERVRPEYRVRLAGRGPDGLPAGLRRCRDCAQAAGDYLRGGVEIVRVYCACENHNGCARCLTPLAAHRLSA